MKKLTRSMRNGGEKTPVHPTTSGVPCIHLRIGGEDRFHEYEKWKTECSEEPSPHGYHSTLPCLRVSDGLRRAGYLLSECHAGPRRGRSGKAPDFRCRGPRTGGHQERPAVHRDADQTDSWIRPAVSHRL